MVFSKSFPKQVKNSTVWQEVFLSKKEESFIEDKAKKENILLMKECLFDAETMMSDLNLKQFQSDTVSLAIALFEKRASHTVFWKENRCKDKFFK